MFPEYLCVLKNGRHFREFLLQSFRYVDIAFNNAKRESFSDCGHDLFFTESMVVVKGTLKLVGQELM